MYHKITKVPFEGLMRSIADFFTVNLTTSRHNGVEYWNVEIGSFKRMHNIVDYLNKFPLLTSKRNDFDSFKIAFNMVLVGKHLTIEGKQIIHTKVLCGPKVFWASVCCTTNNS